jgi:hypothetical protein
LLLLGGMSIVDDDNDNDSINGTATSLGESSVYERSQIFWRYHSEHMEANNGSKWKICQTTNNLSCHHFPTRKKKWESGLLNDYIFWHNEDQILVDCCGCKDTSNMFKKTLMAGAKYHQFQWLAQTATHSSSAMPNVASCCQIWSRHLWDNIFLTYRLIPPFGTHENKVKRKLGEVTKNEEG